MATCEADFKVEFKEGILHEYPDAHIWTSTDLLRSGLPDFYILWRGLFVAVEAKFITKLPKKSTSLVLSHTVSGAQKQFLEKTNGQGQLGVVVIGSPHAAVVCRDIKENYTLGDITKAHRVRKDGRLWKIGGLLNEWRDEVFL